MWAWYNEIDPYAAQWLRNLIANKLITDGEVDERPVQDVKPCDLTAFTRCHFFAGIAGWDLALRLADFPTDQKVWTGSCPCQGFSAAGKSLGFADERHLWPYWHHLIDQCRPPIIFGEQVASKLALEWLDLVHADLESAGYSVGTADLCAAGVGAPHIRQRLWFVADARSARAGWHAGSGAPTQTQGDIERREAWGDASDTSLACCATRKLADANATGRDLERSGGLLDGERPALGDDADGCSVMGNTDNSGLEGWFGSGGSSNQRTPWPSSMDGELGDAARDQQRRPRLPETSGGRSREAGRPSAWSDCDWLPCTDGKARPVEPGSFPLAHGVQRRASKLRAYGNAIVPQAAAEFIKAYLDCRP